MLQTGTIGSEMSVPPYPTFVGECISDLSRVCYDE